MATLQLKNLPDDLHSRLRARAGEQHMTMRDYVLALLEDDLRRPSIREWATELARRGPLGPDLGSEDVVETLHRSREERDAHLLGTVGSERREAGDGGPHRGG